MSEMTGALLMPLNATVSITRAKKNITTTGKIISHWDDDSENGGSFRVGLIIEMVGFSCAGIKVPNNRYKFIQREDGSYFPSAKWASKIGSFKIQVVKEVP